MSGSRAPASAVAFALLLAALAAAGCGLGPGADVGTATLTVTRDFGAEPVLPPASDRVSESDTVMRLLERNAGIETRYSGGFVQSIEGIEGAAGGSEGPFDWFFYVDGIESTVGAAQYPLHGGERVWWDYHRWSATLHIPAVVGSWPAPLAGGYEGHDGPVALLCRGAGAACGIVRERLRAEGVPLSTQEGGGIRVLVGPWALLRDDPAAAQIDRGPGQSGVFASMGADGGCEVVALDEAGQRARALGPGAGLLAATRRYEDPPTWVVTGCDRHGVSAAARLLDRRDLADRFAVAVGEGGPPVPLPRPVREGGG